MSDIDLDGIIVEILTPQAVCKVHNVDGSLCWCGWIHFDDEVFA